MKNRAILFLGLAAVLLAGLLSPLASSYPDGLERVGEDLGFIDRAVVLFSSPVPDYTWPGLPASLSGPAAGVLGVAVTLIVALSVAKLQGRSRSG